MLSARMEEQSKHRNRVVLSRSVKVLEGRLNPEKAKAPTFVLLPFKRGNTFPHTKLLLIHPPRKPEN